MRSPTERRMWIAGMPSLGPVAMRKSNSASSFSLASLTIRTAAALCFLAFSTLVASAEICCTT